MDLGTNNTKVLSSIMKNENSSVPKPELCEEIIYIKGVTGDTNIFSDTYLLNRTFNNVESIELVGGYINDNRFAPDSLIIGDGPQESYSIEEGIERDTQEIFGSIGPIPFVWIDLDTPDIDVYNHYTNLNVSSIDNNCSDCSGNVNCIQCNQSSEIYDYSVPQGSFFVQLKQYNFLDHYYKAGAINTSENSLEPAKNIVYLIDEPSNYIHKFNNLTSIDKLKINIRNIVGKPLWGCDNNRAEREDSKINTSELGKETNLLRWELIFKVKYYINKMGNIFLLQSS